MASISPTELQKMFFFGFIFFCLERDIENMKWGWYGGEEDLAEFEGMRNIIKIYLLIKNIFK